MSGLNCWIWIWALVGLLDSKPLSNGPRPHTKVNSVINLNRGNFVPTEKFYYPFSKTLVTEPFPLIFLLRHLFSRTQWVSTILSFTLFFSTSKRILGFSDLWLPVIVIVRGGIRGLQVRVGAMEEEAIRCDEVLAEGEVLGVSPAPFNCAGHAPHSTR